MNRISKSPIWLIIFLLIGCDPIVQYHKKIVLEKTLNDQCILNAEKDVPDLLKVTQRKIGSENSILSIYYFLGEKETVTVGYSFEKQPELHIHFGWIGLEDKERESKYLNLFKLVSKAVATSCNIDESKLKVTYSCIRTSCPKQNL